MGKYDDEPRVVLCVALACCPPPLWHWKDRLIEDGTAVEEVGFQAQNVRRRSGHSKQAIRR